jgi:uncharacterized Zn-binding protein involved in type VI secretion
MPPAARISDMHVCPKVEPGPVPHVGGPTSSGEVTVIIGGMPAARVGDSLVCFGGPPDSISQGEPTVIIGGMPAARLGDSTSHGGALVAGCPTVIIGSSAQAQTLIVAAQNGTPFCEECEKRKAQAEPAPAPPQAPAPASAIANTAPLPSKQEMLKQEIQREVSRKAASVDRWLDSSKHRVAARYRKAVQKRSGFAALIRGRMIDVKMRPWLRKKYGRIPGARIDQTIPGSGSRLRPDLYLPDVDGQSVIYEIGGKTKSAGKYKGLAARTHVIYTTPKP